MRRAFAVFIAIALSSGVLAGCAPSGGDVNCTYAPTAGDATAAVTVSQNFGGLPDVTFATPLKASSNHSVILTTGSGNKTKPGDIVAIDAALFDGGTGAEISSTKFSGEQLAMLSLDSRGQPAITDALECVSAGSRVVAVLGDAPDLLTALGLPAGSTVVGVFDVHSVYLGKADGTPQVVPDGFPMIVLTEDGTPGITFLSGSTAPAELRIALLKKGSGPEVRADSVVTVAYSGWLWPTDSSAPVNQFDSSWTKGTPATFNLAGGVISGFAKALVGQRVGSQVEVIIPPSEGYGDKDNGLIPAGSTLVFVIDILGVN